MKDYEDFKAVLETEMLHYLPEQFKNYRVQTEYVPKVNGFLDALSIMPPEGCGAAPTLYFADLYAYYLKCQSMEQVLCCAAEVYLRGMNYLDEVNLERQLEEEPPQIVYSLVGASINQELAEIVPYRLYLDMMIIYRLMTEDGQGGFNSAIITNDIMEELQMTEDELYTMAAENTPKLMPLSIRKIEDAFYCMSNQYNRLGAASILYEDGLRKMADFLEDDLYILPASIHEVFLMPASECNLRILGQAVRTANREIVQKSEVLTDSVYYYNWLSDEVEIASERKIN